MTSSSLSEFTNNPAQPTVIALNKPIVLIGLMGAGKTTVGRRLAKVIGRDFVDSDAEIEEAAACSISDIFGLHGEGIFRDLEERVIRRLLEQPNLVIATGGGAWMQPHIRSLIQKSSLSVWLHADLETLLDRVSKRSHRPLLEQGNKRDILEKLIEQRYPVYSKADLTVHSAEGPHEQVVDAVIQTIQTHLEAV